MKFGEVNVARDALRAALKEVVSSLAAAQTVPGQASRSQSLPTPVAQGRNRHRPGSLPGNGLGGAPHLVSAKVGLEEALQKLEAYDALPAGMLAMLPARRAGIDQLKQAITALQTKARTFNLSSTVQSALSTAHANVAEASGMIQHLENMYGSGGGDPGYHWRLLSGLIGGYSASFEQTGTPRIGQQVWTQGLTPIRIMETLTPTRNFVDNWSSLIGDWLDQTKQGNTQEPFLLWYEGRQKQSVGTNYLSDAARRAALVTLTGGKLQQLAPTGDGSAVTLQPLTTAAFHESGSYDMFMAYCLDEFGVLYVYPHKEGAGAGLIDLANKRLNAVAGENVTKSGPIFHSSGHRGQPVAGAGMIQVVDGFVVAISTKSGHYWPTVEMFLQTLEFLSPALGNGVAYFDFLWDGEMCVASCPAREFLRIGRAGFSPAAVSETFLFGPMDLKTGGFETDDSGVFDGQLLRQCAEYFLATYSRYTMSETRRILEERRLAQRTRLGIYRGRTLDAVLFREWEREQMMKTIAAKDGDGFLNGQTPFDKTPLDPGVAARHHAQFQGLQQGSPQTRQRSNDFKRYK